MLHSPYETAIFIVLLLVVLVIPRYRNAILIFSRKDEKRDDKINQQRNRGIDFLKGLAVLAVIVIHVIYFTLEAPLSITEVFNINLLNAILRFAIGAFLISSGYLLKPPKSWLSGYGFNWYWKKIVRIGMPYALVTLVLWWINLRDTSYLGLLISGRGSIPFYFVPVLFQLYLLYPFLDIIRKKYPHQLLLASFGISTLSFLTGILYVAGDTVLFTQFLFFFVYGMTIGDKMPNFGEKWRQYLELLGIYLVLHAVVGYQYLNIAYNSEYSLANNLATHVFNTQLVYAVLVTQILIFIGQKFSYNWIAFIAWIGKMSLWIFLLHFPIQEYIFLPVYNNAPNIIVAMIIHGLLTFFLTLVLTILVGNFYTLTCGLLGRIFKSKVIN